MLDRIKRLYSFDLESLAVFRIGLGLTLITDLVLRSLDIFAHYTDTGLISRQAQQTIGDPRGVSDFSLLFLSDGRLFIVVFFVITALVYSAFTLGYKTKLFTILSLLALISIQNRTGIILNRSDDTIKFALMWSLFMPVGGMYSMDYVAEKAYKAKKYWAKSMVPILYCIQIFMFYAVNSVSKTASVWTSSGSALEMVYSLENLALPLGTYLLKFPDLLQIITKSVLFIEFAIAMLALVMVPKLKTRRSLLLLALALHIPILLTLKVGLHPIISIIMLIPFMSKDMKVIKFANKLLSSIFERLILLKDNFADYDKYFNSVNRPVSSLLDSYRMATPVLSGFIVLLFVYNFSPHFGFIKSPDFVDNTVKTLSLHQDWTLFAPSPPSSEHQFVVRSSLEDGREIDVWKYIESGGSSGDFNLEYEITEHNNNHRWNRFFEWAARDSYEPYRHEFLKYTCRSWKTSFPKIELAETELYLVTKENVIDNDPVYRSSRVSNVNCLKI